MLFLAILSKYFFVISSTKFLSISEKLFFCNSIKVVNILLSSNCNNTFFIYLLNILSLIYSIKKEDI